MLHKAWPGVDKCTAARVLERAPDISGSDQAVMTYPLHAMHAMGTRATYVTTSTTRVVTATCYMSQHTYACHVTQPTLGQTVTVGTHMNK